MNSPVPLRRWFGLGRAAAPFDHGDWADQGTAFGMELSLSEMDDEPADDAAPASAAPTPVPAAAQLDWMQRLWARRKPAF